jgi:hypothetical protein
VHLLLPQGFSLKAVKHLVLDEADKLLDMDFEQEIDQILKVSPQHSTACCCCRAWVCQLGMFWYKTASSSWETSSHSTARTRAPGVMESNRQQITDAEQGVKLLITAAVGEVQQWLLCLRPPQCNCMATTGALDTTTYMP